MKTLHPFIGFGSEGRPSLDAMLRHRFFFGVKFFVVLTLEFKELCVVRV